MGLISDTLVSTDVMEANLGLCEGPIAGLARGGKDFFLGDTPFLNTTSGFNFENWQLDLHHGSDDPTPPQNWQGSTSSNESVGVQLAYGVEVYRTSPSNLTGQFSRIDLRFVISALQDADDKGNTRARTLRIRIHIRPVGSTDWVNVLGDRYVKVSPSQAQIDDYRYQRKYAYYRNKYPTWDNWTLEAYARRKSTISSVEREVATYIKNYVATHSYTDSNPALDIYGKTTSTFVQEHRIYVDPTENVDYEIRVIKYTDSEANPYVSADVQWESIQYVSTETRAYDDLAVVRVHGPSSDVLSGVPEFSGFYACKLVNVPSNYDPVTRYYDGVWDGTWKKAFTTNPVWILYDLCMNTRFGLKKHYPNLSLDRFSFYDAAKWCDEFVPVPNSEWYQPRWTYSDTIRTRRNALTQIAELAGVFGGVLLSGMNGEAYLAFDKPESPTQIFTPQNVFDGEFLYQFSEITTRYNDVTVKFQNPDLNGQEDVRRVFDQDLIDKNGRIPNEFVAIGCDDPHEATRRAWRRLLQANRETMTVSFQTARAGLSLEPMSIIGISDPDMNFGLSGRIKSIGGGEIKLRDRLLVPTNETLNLTAQTNAGLVELQVIAYNSYTDTLFYDPEATPAINPLDVFTLSHDTLGLAKPFRVISLRPEGEMIAVTALEVDVNKHGDIDNLTSSGTVFYDFDGANRPKQPVIAEATSGTDQLLQLPNGRIQSRILIQIEPPAQTLVKNYVCRYRALGETQWRLIGDLTSPTFYIPNVDDMVTYEIEVRAVDSLDRRSSFSETLIHQVIGKSQPPADVSGLQLTVLEDQSLQLRWEANTEIDLDHYLVLLDGSVYGEPEVNELVASRKLGVSNAFEVYAVDTSGNVSEVAAEVSYTYPQTATPTVTSSFTLDKLTLKFDCTTPDVVYTVWDHTGTRIHKGSTNALTLSANWTGTRTYRVTAKNAYMPQSEEISTTVEIVGPTAPTVSHDFHSQSIEVTWNDTTAGTLEISHYQVFRNGNLRAPAAAGTSWLGAANWIGDMTFTVVAVDMAGNVSAAGSTTATITAAQVQTVSAQVSKGQMTLDWTTQEGTIRTEKYRILRDGVRIGVVDAETFSLPVDWTGATTFEVIPIDPYGRAGGSQSHVETLDPPEAPTFTTTLNGEFLLFNWEEPASELPVAKYQIDVNGIVFDETDALTTRWRVAGGGLMTFGIRAVDSAGQLGARAILTHTIDVPKLPQMTGQVVNRSYVLTWEDAETDLPLKKYHVYREGDVIFTGLAEDFSLTVDWGGTLDFSVEAIDSGGNVGPRAYHQATITPPSKPVPTVEVLDNNVMLRWIHNPRSLPVVETEVQRQGRVEQIVDANFATFFEFASDVYSYSLVAIDSAGNRSAVVSLEATVSEPPDFVLQLNHNSQLDGARSRVLLDGQRLIFGVDTAESYSEHFTSEGFTGPSDQIGAGYPMFLQPSDVGEVSVYQEVVDYGALLSSTQVTVTPTITKLAGDPSLEVDIEYREDTTSEWRGVTNRTQVYAQNFRYVRVTLRVTPQSREDLLYVTGINLILSSKLRNDSGTGYANAGGTFVNFKYGFVDVESITVTAKGTTPVTAIYDFVDEPNPAGFTVYLFDPNGNPVSGHFSWGAKGY